MEERKHHPGSRQVSPTHATRPPRIQPTSARPNGTESLPPRRFRVTPQPRPAPHQAAPPSTGQPNPRLHNAGHLCRRRTGGQAAQDLRRRRRVDGHAAQYHALAAPRACPAVHLEDAVQEPSPGKPAAARQLRAPVRPAESQLLLRHGLPRGTLGQSDQKLPRRQRPGRSSPWSVASFSGMSSKEPDSERPSRRHRSERVADVHRSTRRLDVRPASGGGKET